MGVANISGNILTDSGASLSSYLPLTGGTLTGALNGTSATFSSTSGIGLTIQADWDRSATNNNQLYIRGNSNTNKQLRLGYDTTGNVGYIQALTSGTSVDNLLLNPSGGNVGIGSTNPTSISTFKTLEIQGSTGAGIRLWNGTNGCNIQHDGTDAYINNFSNGGIYLYTNSLPRMLITSGGQLQVRQDALFGLDYNSTQYISISENQIRRLGNAILFINNSNTGDVSININGGGTFVNGTNGYGRAVTNSSDIRIKKNISSIDNALNKVLQMNGVYYEFNNENELGINVPSGNTRIGLIAQDIENILPEAVLTPLEENQPKSIDYSGMIGLLINAINELNAKVTALENK